jgi:dolichyl-phosphate beta-glucosyltransferase
MFNERDRIAESLPALVAFISAYAAGSELVLVDDGSTDGTSDVVMSLLEQRPPDGLVRLVSQSHRGKGGTIRAGLAQVTTHYAGFCDVDLSTPLDELHRLVALATIGPALVIGSRDVFTTNLIVPESGGREILGKCFNLLVRATLAPGIYDTQCGAKVAATAVWRQIMAHSREDGFAWDVEAVAIARRLSFAVWEAGVSWSHDSRSRVRPWRDGLGMVRAVPRIWRGVRAVRTVGNEAVFLETVSVDETQAALSLCPPA